MPLHGAALYKAADVAQDAVLTLDMAFPILMASRQVAFAFEQERYGIVVRSINYSLIRSLRSHVVLAMINPTPLLLNLTSEIEPQALAKALAGPLRLHPRH